MQNTRTSITDESINYFSLIIFYFDVLLTLFVIHIYIYLMLRYL